MTMFRWLAAILVCITLSASMASAQTFTPLHQFEGEDIDGAGPIGGLALAGDTLYGTTYYGGKQVHGTINLSGTIFAIDLAGNNYRVVHSFAGQPTDGAGPLSGLTLGGGMLYGTTTAGGTYDYGTVFSYNPATGAYKVLYSFTNVSDGLRPVGELLYANNTLYGTTVVGGNGKCTNLQGCGTLFSIDLKTVGTDPNAFTTLYRFTGGADGAIPRGNLVLLNDTIYGITTYGGTTGCYGGNGCGTIYQFSLKTNKLIQSYAFPYAKGHLNDGAEPEFGLTYANGLLYGATVQGGPTGGTCAPSGCGTVFSFNPNSVRGRETPLFVQFGYPTGIVPSGGLTIYGAGTNSAAPTGFAIGGAAYGGELPSPAPNCEDVAGPFGTIFQVNLANPLQTTALHAFACKKDGATPTGKLVQANGAIYGVTYQGGAYDSGTVFMLQLPIP